MTRLAATLIGIIGLALYGAMYAWLRLTGRVGGMSDDI